MAPTATCGGACTGSSSAAPGGGRAERVDGVRAVICRDGDRACACARADGTIRRIGYASSAWGTVRRSGCLWAAATDVVKDEVGIRGRGRGFVEVVDDGLWTGLLILLFTFSARFSVL